MPQNVGSVDRWIRIVLGIVLLGATVYGPHTAWGYIGLVPLITGVMGWCPLYSILGKSTKTGPRLGT